MKCHWVCKSLARPLGSSQEGGREGSFHRCVLSVCCVCASRPGGNEGPNACLCPGASTAAGGADRKPAKGSAGRSRVPRGKQCPAVEGAEAKGRDSELWRHLRRCARQTEGQGKGSGAETAAVSQGAAGVSKGGEGRARSGSACGGGGLGAGLTLQEALGGAGPPIIPAPGVGSSRPCWPTRLASALCLHHLGLGSAPPSCGTWRNLP